MGIENIKEKPIKARLTRIKGHKIFGQAPDGSEIVIETGESLVQKIKEKKQLRAEIVCAAAPAISLISGFEEDEDQDFHNRFLKLAQNTRFYREGNLDETCRLACVAANKESINAEQLALKVLQYMYPGERYDLESPQVTIVKGKLTEYYPRNFHSSQVHPH